MYYIKPAAILNLQITDRYIDDLDINELIETFIFTQGKNSQGKYTNYFFVNSSFNLEERYQNMPRAFRYQCSQAKFDNMQFLHNKVYTEHAHWDIIQEDYCREILKKYPDHKGANQLLAELKDEFPENFI